jgi:hypothetical protein
MALIRMPLVSLAIFAFILTGGPVGESLELQRAREEVARLKELVDAGAIPKARLEQVQEQIADGEDDTILRQTLYGSLSVEDLTEQQSTEMVEAAQRRLARQSKQVDRLRTLVDSGVVARSELAPLVEELEARRRTLELADGRARLLRELAEMAKAEERAEEVDAELQIIGPKRVAERYPGDRSFGDSVLRRVVLAYEREFGRPLPISARGETNLHRSLGFDHRGRVDVALNPDQKEGVWLRTYLESTRIPYIAFRAAVPGQATAPHIHIGPPSNRLRAAD